MQFVFTRVELCRAARCAQRREIHDAVKTGRKLVKARHFIQRGSQFRYLRAVGQDKDPFICFGEQSCIGHGGQRSKLEVAAGFNQCDHLAAPIWPGWRKERIWRRRATSISRATWRAIGASMVVKTWRSFCFISRRTSGG